MRQNLPRGDRVHSRSAFPLPAEKLPHPDGDDFVSRIEREHVAGIFAAKPFALGDRRAGAGDGRFSGNGSSRTGGGGAARAAQVFAISSFVGNIKLPDETPSARAGIGQAV